MLGSQEIVAPASQRTWTNVETSDGVVIPFSESISVVGKISVTTIKLTPRSLKERELILPNCGIDITVMDCAEGDPVEFSVNDGETYHLGQFGCMVVYPYQSYTIFNASRNIDATLKLAVIQKEAS
jgi:hypothetical protein